MPGLFALCSKASRPSPTPRAGAASRGHRSLWSGIDPKEDRSKRFDVANRRISFSNGSRREALRGVDAFGCLRSLRARSALDGVSWVQRGLVEIAVGPRLTACYEIRAVVCSLPRASLLLGAGFGLLSRGLRGLGERELRSVSQHRVHNDREATSQSDPSVSHR